MNEFNINDGSEVIDDSIPDHNPDAFRQDVGGLVTSDNGVADSLLRNDKLFNTLKGDWKREGHNLSHNIKVTTGREDGKFYIKREQLNVEYIAEICADYRQRAEAGYVDPLAPLMPDGKIGHKWMELPDVIAIQISNDYFGGMSWHTIKRDKTLKAQFYRVVEQEYPAKVGATAFFKGANFAGKH
jgi:hypothetical protein